MITVLHFSERFCSNVFGKLYPVSKSNGSNLVQQIFQKLEVFFIAKYFSKGESGGV